MSFGTLTLSGADFEPRQPGYYSHAGTDFSSPDNYIKIRGGSRRADGNLSAGINRVIEVEDAVTGETYTSVVSINLIVPDNGTVNATTLEGHISQLHAFLTAGNISDMLQGKY